MSKRNNIPYIDIINQFKSACTSSLSISTFDTGTIDFLDANAVNKDYPYIYLRPISSPGVVDKVRSLTFELYSLDVPKLSDESPVKVLSTTEQRIYELIAWFNQGPAILQQVYDITITDLSPVNEAFQDRVFGWVATIEIATPWQWDYCDYPRNDWPTPTPTSSPTPSPTTSPTATPTPTGPTPTPSTSPTATPTGTPGPTATATPFPTPPPSPTPTPTAAPESIGFLIGDDNLTGSLNVACDNTSTGDTTVYVRWFDEDPSFPDRVVGKEIYSDATLDTVYTSSAIFDGTVNRLIQSGSIFGAIELEWMQGTASNIVNTMITCSYPIIETDPHTPTSFTSSLLNGHVDDYAGRTLKDFGFEWGTTPLTSSFTNSITASYPGASGEWSASLENLEINVPYYYRAVAYDNTTSFPYYGDVVAVSGSTAYAWPFWTDNSFNINSNLNGALQDLNTQKGSMCSGAGWGAGNLNWVPVSIPFTSGSHLPVSAINGAYIFNDREFTQPGPGAWSSDYDNYYNVQQYSKYKDSGDAGSLTGGMDNAIITKVSQDQSSVYYHFGQVVSGSSCTQS